MKLEVVPLTVFAAVEMVSQWHRHLPDIQGGLFAAGLACDRALVAVAIAGNPARVWQGTGRISITRVAAKPVRDDGGGERNACSKLYGAMCRAAQALGYREAWTYSLPEESGESLRGAGFIEMGVSPGGEWNSASKPRKPAVRPDPKLRWMRVLGDPLDDEIIAALRMSDDSESGQLSLFGVP